MFSDFMARMQTRDREATYADLVKQKKQQAWAEDTTPWQKELLIDHRSWNPVRLFDTPPLHGIPGALIKATDRACILKKGLWVYANHVLPKGGPGLYLHQRDNKGRVWFDGDIVIPTLCRKSPFNAETTTWMSYTPQEVISQRPGVKKARGRVVVGGLGLGWFLNKVCARPSVTEVVVVDREQGLLDWLLPAVRAKYPAVAAKPVTAVCSDIYEYMTVDHPKNHGTRYLLDVWEDYGGAYWDDKFQAWKKKLFTQVWGWGDFVPKEERVRY